MLKHVEHSTLNIGHSTLSIRVVRLGTPRHPREGLRLGTVRRPPRGVPRSEFAKRDYYDVWVPELAPSADLVAWATSQPFTSARWKRFAREYRKEMRASGHLISLLAKLSAQTNFSVGCYCADESTCHRSLLRQLLQEAGAKVTK
jgi:uncharacterized protein YeaO (DUF488 family)